MNKKILINIILIIFILLLAELYSFISIDKANKNFKLTYVSKKNNISYEYKTKYRILEDFKPDIIRKSFYSSNNNKAPIIWFGCSYAEGAGLEDTKTPCRKISQLTNRSCINKSKGATGTQFVYYQLINGNIKEEVPEADFVIYTFIYNHINRLYNCQINPLIDTFNIRYRYKNGKLEEIKPFFRPIYSSFLVKQILKGITNIKIKKEETNFRLFNKLMREISKLVKAEYPNAKFIMLEFPDKSFNELPRHEIHKLESYGIEVVKVTDLTKNINIYDDKYWLEDTIHPSDKLWDIILPELKTRYSM